MDKITFNKLIKPLIDIYDEIELDIIRDILSRLENYNSVSGSMEWYLEKLQDLGVLKKDTLDILKKDKSRINKILKEVINESSKSDTIEKFQNLYDNKTLDKKPLELFESSSINNLINNATKEVNDIMNLIDSKVLEGTDEAYKRILNKAYIETTSGVYTYQESIRNALKDFANEGIDAGHYANGRSISIEAITRRDVLTKVNKLTGDITLEMCKQMGINTVYVDQHEGARIRTPYMKNDYEAHAEWQGKVYMIDGSSDKYDNFYEKTGYGEMLGLKGINCYHDFRPFFEGEKVPEKISEKDNKKKYELFEKQRQFERRIRELKREKEIYKSIDKDEYKNVSNKLKNKNNEYDEFLKQNNLRRDYSREYIADYSTSEVRIPKEDKSDVLVVKPDIQNYEDVTEKMIKDVDTSYQETIEATSVIKNNKEYKVNKTNIIEYKNKEKENGQWFVSKFGGKIEYMPTIYEDGGVSCADYKYYSKKDTKDWIYLEEKEVSGKGKNSFYHALEDKEKQSDIFLIDCTESNLTAEEIHERLKVVFTSSKTKYVKTIIIKNKEELFGIFRRK